MKSFVSLIVLSLSFSVMADGILCSKDHRPVDGPYTEVKLQGVKLFGDEIRYNLTRTVISSGFGGPVETSKSTLGNDLNCNIKGLVAFCSSTFSFSSSTFVTFRLRQETVINSLTQTAPSKIPEKIIINVDSPLVANHNQTFEFSHFSLNNMHGHCQEI